MKWITVSLAFFLPLGGFAAQIETPRSLDPAASVSLFASEPDIVTPIGAAIDSKGRLFVVESNTHFRPKDYKGPPTDRILLWDTTSSSPKPAIFYEGEKLLMNLVAESDSSLLVSQRDEIFRLDSTGKNKTTLAHLETKSVYPHNGLHGLASDGQYIYVGIGENYGAPWTLIAADGSKVSNDTGSGTIFRMDTQGWRLVRFAHGFWNPFGLGVGWGGQPWAVDNDADGRPPCRLIQVLQGADYGFQLRYGRTGLHPLQCWDGELPGTMKMTAGVGEAPCAVLPFGHDLLVSSWRDHVVQRIVLSKNGASYAAKVKTLLSGGDDFRPVGLAAGIDNSVFITDWASNSYPVHGKGRIWKLTFQKSWTRDVQSIPDPEQQKLAELRTSHDVPKLISALDDPDPAIAQAAQFALSQLAESERIDWSDLHTPRQRIGVLRALIDRHFDLTNLAAMALSDDDDRVRQMGIRCITEENLKPLHPAVDRLMTTKQLSPRSLMMCAAALTQLDGDPAAKVDVKKLNSILAERLHDPKASDEVKTSMLHMLLAAHPKINLPPLETAPPAFQLQAVRYLNDDNDPSRFDRLAKLAVDSKVDLHVRAEAIDGLSDDAANRLDFLVDFATGDDATLRAEALRSLRSVGDNLSAEQKSAISRAATSDDDRQLFDLIMHKPLTNRPPSDQIDRWQRLVAEKPGDPQAGYRVFFHHAAAGCYHCHMLEGRGRQIGPDLTMIGQSQSTGHILESILDPSKEIAPLYTLWTIKTRSGQRIDGMLLRRDTQVNEVYVDSAGVATTVREPDVASRQIRKESLMPTNLVDGMTDQELRDVIALLLQKRKD